MDRATAHKLVMDYVEGGKENNKRKILSTLCGNCIIVESHGPAYRGIETVESWLDAWISRGSLVNDWDVCSFVFEDDRAAFEWDFTCEDRGERSQIRGASVLRFQSRKISEIHEYRMSKQSFDWK